MRRKPFSIIVIIFLTCWLANSLFSQKKFKESELPSKYQEWLNLVAYIILPQEKEVFLQLDNDRDRDLFIEAFWRQRDPTPGTPENEYKEEHIRRFNYANKFFGRSTTREGWRTDMGRIYIILGEPVSIERFESSSFIVPCQAWSYYGDPKKDLPPHFVLLFYQRGGVGEYKLYDPVADGPINLLIDKRDVDPTNYEELYEKIKEIAPTLADIAISLVPGEFTYGYTPSPRNNIIMANIFESPRKDVNPSYATHFLNYKGVVSTEYLTNFVDSESMVEIIPDPVTGLSFVHLSVVPKSISVDYYEPKDQYYCPYQLNLSLRVQDNIIFQYTKDIPFYFSKQDARKVQVNGLSIEDSFPIIEGTYKLIVLLQNPIAKEFSLLEKEIFVPGQNEPNLLFGPYLGYRSENYQVGLHLPYKILDKKLMVDPKNVFSPQDEAQVMVCLVEPTQNIWQEGQIRLLIKGLKEVNPTEKAYLLKLASQPRQRIMAFNHALDVAELTPDYYELKVQLIDGQGNVLREKTGHFIVSREKAVPHPMVSTKGLSLANRHLLHLMVAHQYEKMNLSDQAEAQYKKALELKPDYSEARLSYSQFLVRNRKFEQALEVLTPLAGEERFKFEYYLWRGFALMGLGRYEEAKESLLEGNKIYNSDTRLLNALGECFFRTGDKNRALEVLRASLRLNANQPAIKKLIEELEKK
ncbi:MAG: GWxTD domain-containing protein [Candidatus Aminicenantes bacterium]|nr:GWxTD domain-containing protein [Candidatus Aminicenantes bacterium]